MWKYKKMKYVLCNNSSDSIRVTGNFDLYINVYISIYMISIRKLLLALFTSVLDTNYTLEMNKP